MRLSLTLAAPLLVLLTAGGVQAAASPETINNVLAGCPVDAAAGTCSGAVSDFAGSLEDADRDSDLLNLATSLAQKAQGSQVDPEACVEIKAGIDAAASAASATASSQISALGEPLCDVDASATGSISAGDDGYVVPQSSVEQNDSTRN
jgi:hypothetical protein